MYKSTLRVRTHYETAALRNIIRDLENRNPNENVVVHEEAELIDQREPLNENSSDEDDNLNEIIQEHEVSENDSDAESEDRHTIIDLDESISSSSDEEFVDDVVLREEEPDEVNQLRTLAVTGGIKQCTVDKMLNILRQRLLPQLPKSSKTFLGTSSAVYNIKEMQDSDGTFGEYVYFGIEKGLRECIDPNVHIKTTIFLQFNVDGICLTKSGVKGFWVMSGKVFYKPNIYKPFVILIYSGNSKPNIYHYLRDFIAEINRLITRGITISNKKFNVRIHCFICDTPARAFLKCTKGHTGFYSCERCEIRGLKLNRVTQFPLVNCPERTNDSFRNYSQQRHHTGRSPILTIRQPVNMISMFALDFMHLFCQGIIRRLLMTWFEVHGDGNVGQVVKTEVSRRLIQLRKSMPLEFQRKPRSLKYLKKWKATELRFFLLYCGPIVLLNLLQENRQKNFLLLHVACRILCNDNLIQEFQQHAKSYLQRFFVSVGILYTRMQVLNTHSVPHAADDVVSLGCSFNEINAFPFENFLGKLTGLLRNANRPLAQVCRRLHELNMISPPKPHIPFKMEILKSKGSDIFKLKYRQCTLTTKFPNNFVMLKNNDVFEINKITRVIDEIKIQGINWKKKKPIFEFPTSSSDLFMWQIVKDRRGVLSSFDIDFVKLKMVILKMNLVRSTPRRIFCMPLLHHDDE